MNRGILGSWGAFLAGALVLFAGCSGGDGSSGSGGSAGSGGGGPTCDVMTKGFVRCGPTPELFTNCQPGTFCEDPNFQMCSNGCASDVNCGCGETCVSGSCIQSSVCGDGTCDGMEDASSCPADCKTGTCGNGNCDVGETAQSCAADCSGSDCGDGACDPDETVQTCLVDCLPVMCGNGTCNPGETTLNCPSDCNSCGNGQCDAGETSQTCPGDCKPMPCGDGTCAGTETPVNCQIDCQQLGAECSGNCDSYDFFMCLQPGELQTCYDSCDAATGPMLKQFNNGAATATVSCDLSCFAFL